MATVNLCMSRLALLVLALSTLSACDGGSDDAADGEGSSDGEPTLEELIAECEAAAGCDAAMCGPQHAAYDGQVAAEPEYELGCWDMCWEMCSPADSGCVIETCEFECETDRAAEFEAWTTDTDAALADLRLCQLPCLDPWSHEVANPSASCDPQENYQAEVCAIGAGVYGYTCETFLPGVIL